MVFLKSNLPFLVILSAWIVLQLPLSSCSSLKEALRVSPFNQSKESNRNHELSPKMIYEVTIHGLVLWASLGFLMPIGILIIRMSYREESTTRIKLYFYFHLIVQILSLCVVTTEAIMSIKTFENSFSNNHQRIGLAIYGAIWVQAIIGFFRPQRGTKKRGVWYFFHWILGTSTCIMGILNIYIGLEAYNKRTKKNVTLWKVLFTIEISLLAFFYLFQDKWDYIQKQSVCLQEGGQLGPNLWREPCSKVNALKNLFN